MKFSTTAFIAAIIGTAAADKDDTALRALRGNVERKAKADDCSSGNGFPKGKMAFKLNLLGKLEGSPPFNSQGNNIAIKLAEQCRGKNGSTCTVSAETKILLEKSGLSAGQKGAFEVIDPDGTDGVAKLAVPDPFEDSASPCYGSDPDTDQCTEESTYLIFARVRGKGKLDARLCFCDGDDTENCLEGDTYCQTEGVITLEGKKGQKAVDISQQLLTVCADVDGDGNLDGVGLFDEFDTPDGSVDEESYFWSLDNTGARNAELRFFAVGDLPAECFSGVTRDGACPKR